MCGVSTADCTGTDVTTALCVQPVYDGPILLTKAQCRQLAKLREEHRRCYTAFAVRFAPCSKREEIQYRCFAVYRMPESVARVMRL